MVNMPKHCWNLHHSIFVIFIDHCQVNWVGQCLSCWHAKSWECFLIHWLPMKSFLFLIETIWRYQFRSNYLKKKIFPQFFASFLKSRWSFEHFVKKTLLIDFVILKLPTLKTYSDKCLKSPVRDNPFKTNMVNVDKHCGNLHQRIFFIFIDQCKVNWVGKSLCFCHAKSWDCLLTHWLPMKRISFLRETI